MEINKIIGQRINSLLADKHINQKDLAKELGVKDNVISYWCNGTRKPNFEQIIRMSQFFDVSTDYLLGVTNALTNDKDLQFVCDYTGLSEDAIKLLNKKSLLRNLYYMKAEYDLISDLVCNGDLFLNCMQSLKILCEKKYSLKQFELLNEDIQKKHNLEYLSIMKNIQQMGGYHRYKAITDFETTLNIFLNQCSDKYYNEFIEAKREKNLIKAELKSEGVTDYNIPQSIDELLDEIKGDENG